LHTLVHKHGFPSLGFHWVAVFSLRVSSLSFWVAVCWFSHRFAAALHTLQDQHTHTVALGSHLHTGSRITRGCVLATLRYTRFVYSHLAFTHAVLPHTCYTRGLCGFAPFRSVPAVASKFVPSVGFLPSLVTLCVPVTHSAFYVAARFSWTTRCTCLYGSHAAAYTLLSFITTFTGSLVTVHTRLRSLPATRTRWFTPRSVLPFAVLDHRTHTRFTCAHLVRFTFAPSLYIVATFLSFHHGLLPRLVGLPHALHLHLHTRCKRNASSLHAFTHTSRLAVRCHCLLPHIFTFYTSPHYGSDIRHARSPLMGS